MFRFLNNFQGDIDMWCYVSSEKLNNKKIKGK